MEQQQLEFDHDTRRRQFELEKEDRLRKHDIMLQNLEFQKMQMELQLTEVKIRLVQLELLNGN